MMHPTTTTRSKHVAYHQDSHYHLLRNHGDTTLELNKSDFALHQYPIIFHKPPSTGFDYSSTLPKDCESAASEGLQYQQTCEPGLEVTLVRLRMVNDG
ncbi:unnamed protein product [Eruca vesicaria subsp. sativa]|uniref:Uncharacterized protein n=1 Tax=Eruca vesicaria subsp. sativa TaxID=29727 RepID=A0ABC8JHS8_ERUVS|nr:unnamed protein product [Eruca vesicaria subsp. sativa]